MKKVNQNIADELKEINKSLKAVGEQLVIQNKLLKTIADVQLAAFAESEEPQGLRILDDYGDTAAYRG